MFLLRTPALFILPKQHDWQSPFWDWLRMSIWALFGVLTLIVSFSRMSTPERFHCQLTVAVKKESSKSQSNLPHTYQQTKSPSLPAWAAALAPYPPAELWWVASHPWSPGLSGADICGNVSSGTTQRAAREPWGSPRICRKVKSHLLQQLTESISERPAGKVILR